MASSILQELRSLSLVPEADCDNVLSAIMFKREGMQAQIKGSQHRVYSGADRESLYTMVSPPGSLLGSMWNAPLLSRQRILLGKNKMKQMPTDD